MEAALEAGLRKVVHMSSLVVYADSPSEESEPGNPTAIEYARTKWEGELLAWELHRTRDRYIEAIVRRKMPAQVLVTNGISRGSRW